LQIGPGFLGDHADESSEASLGRHLACRRHELDAIKLGEIEVEGGRVHTIGTGAGHPGAVDEHRSWW